uniref:Uncharacterized protein n=1 Tax=Anguilla anguilla TaxID=7936 RepID=A0A0E9RHV4_ANGAN
MKPSYTNLKPHYTNSKETGYENRQRTYT